MIQAFSSIVSYHYASKYLFQFFFSFSCYGDHRDLHSFPTRRSSDLSLTRPLRLDVHAELDLAQAHWDDPERAAPIADDAAVRAGEAGDETGAALARAMGAFHRLFIAQCSPDELEALLLEARGRLEEAEDHVGLAYVWSALGYGVANGRGRTDDWAAASEQSLHHSRLAGRQGLARATDLGVALCLGSRPADEALVTVERLLAEMGRPELLLSRA